MPADEPLPFLDVLRAQCALADAAEGALRTRFAREVAELERARVFAHRRVALVAALAKAITGAPDDAAACSAGERVLELECALTRAEPAHGASLDAFRPVIDAIDTLLNCEDEATPQSVAEALAAFEADYETRMGTPFLALYDVYRPQTPVVDF